MEEKDEIVISLSDVWNIIKKNAAFIIVVTLICAIGSFFITRYFIPKLYTSSIQLYVDTSNDDENKNNLNILSEQTYAQNLVATYIKMLNTNTFLHRAFRAYKTTNIPLNSLAKWFLSAVTKRQRYLTLRLLLLLQMIQSL